VRKWISDLQSFSDQAPSDMFIEALKDGELLMLDYRSKSERQELAQELQ
jgi:hypothetical protein